MSDVNINTPASKSHSETIIEMYVILNLAEIGEMIAIPENQIELDTLGSLFSAARLKPSP